MNPRPDKLVIASRGSRLAVRQAEIVSALITEAHPGLAVEIRTIKTTGDRDGRPFADIGGKGLFMAEVERAVVDGVADVAVHSAKDLTARLAPGCTIVCVPRRASAHDVVVGGEGQSGEDRLGSLPPGASVGTSSMRRRALLQEARPDLNAVELRGNLDTRLAKVRDGKVDAAIVAAAGIERLDVPEAPIGPLDPAWWTPAPAQGALAVEALTERDDLADLFVGLGDPDAAAEVALERAFSERLEGGCSVPLGCLARAHGGDLTATAFLGSPGGGRSLRDKTSGPPALAASMGRELAEAILDAGGADIIEDIRASDPVEPSPP